MTELRPCPFCGKPARIQTYTNERKAIVCDNMYCPCFMSGNVFDTEAEAVTAWNTRDAELAAVTPLKNTIFELLNTLLLGARSGEGITAKWCRELYEKYKGLDQ